MRYKCAWCLRDERRFGALLCGRCTLLTVVLLALCASGPQNGLMRLTLGLARSSSALSRYLTGIWQMTKP